MLMPLDHVVIAVHDLDRASADFSAMGFTVLPGGQHAAPRTSHNALIVFDDGSYIELIAWRSAPPPPEPWYDSLQAHGPGLVDFALLPHNTLDVITAARARGLHGLTGPHAGGRMRPDGQAVVWQTARHDTADLPFLCGDITPRALRVATDPAVRTHANGASGIQGLTVAVRDARASWRRYQALVNLPDSAAPEGDQTVEIALPGCTLRLRQPTPARGEGPVAIRFAGVAVTVDDRVSTTVKR